MAADRCNGNLSVMLTHIAMAAFKNSSNPRYNHEKFTGTYRKHVEIGARSVACSVLQPGEIPLPLDGPRAPTTAEARRKPL
jgi:hypothetical protein